MRKKKYLYKWGINILLILCIVGVSVYYSTGKGFKVFNNVLKNKKTIPIHSVEKEEKVVAITVNTGFGKQFTDEILELLKGEKVEASFFAMGSWIDRYPDSLKKIHKSGHEVGNNSLTYPHFTKITKEQIKSEIEDGDKKIESITGSSSKLFRPPFGDYNEDVIKTITDLGYYSVLWDVDSLDWGSKSEKEITDIILKQVANGSILLFHNNSQKTAGAMEIAIKELKTRGYKFLKVSDLIYKDNYYIDHTGRQREVK
ncbi:polysaccharide deacetylase family protein [Clostridium cylindrosporum]|uniref:Peptidoglycan-N-acetylglucosamine deacetylase PgdA n=1 Tax=Clostridium cylindrosporum DSM 605 TaxID=1121307 RepID=A0A0J8DES3_CLOCY|nr:polysaccharide deacetylase family protein [Clostridium cylindrosporum]KMT22683.1 peptidoglycan-N-acetylglucosamine deacetylase PgdA [Clostridium cylindrosporum DSM 605]